MNPDSVTFLQRFASRNSRLRGQVYADERRVTIRSRPTPDNDEVLKADVQGSDVYHVLLRDDGQAIDVTCTCPHFEQELEVCKHIWATVLEAVRTDAFLGRTFVQFEVSDEDWNELGEQDEESAGRSSARWAPRPVAVRTLSSVPEWKQQLEPVLHSWRNPSQSRTLPPVFELGYIVQIETVLSSIMLEIGVRSPKKNGELSKPRVTEISMADLPRVTDPIDRQVLAFCSNGASSYGQSIPARTRLRSPAAEYIMPLVAASGRYAVKVNGTTIENPTWNDSPWQFAISVERVDSFWELRGVLRRGEEQVDLTSVQVGGGLVLSREEIAPVNDRGAPGLLMLLRRQQVIRAPLGQGDELLRTLLASPELPPIDVPRELAFEIRRPDPTPHLRIGKAEYGDCTAAVSFNYEGSMVAASSAEETLFDASSRVAVRRDREKEGKLFEGLWSVGFRRAFDSDVIVDTKTLPSALPLLVAGGWQIEGTEGVYRAGGELKLSLSSGIDWFDLEATVQFGSAAAALPQLLGALRKGERFVRLDDESLGMITEDWRKRLAPFLESASSEVKKALRFRKSQAAFLDVMLSSREDAVFDEVFQRARERVTEVRPAAEEPPPGFQGTLRHYQMEGLGWFRFLREIGLSGCLADDMGLGKTVQVLALLESRRQDPARGGRPSLVVAPRSLVFNWRAEAERFTPALRVLEHASHDRANTHDVFEDYDLVLTTYGTLRRDAAMFAAARFDYVILDEAQSIKNASSQSAKAARLLQGQHRLALTGTPIENHIGELWSLFEFLNPGMFGGKASRVPPWLKAAGGSGEAAAEARSLVSRVLRPFILRRTKGEVAPELPERVEQTILCEMEPKQRLLYDEMRAYYRDSLLNRVAAEGMNRSKMHVLEALLRLRQAASHPALVDKKYANAPSAKLDALMVELSVLVEEEHKVLVFSQFTSFLALVRAELDKREIRYEYLDGQTRDREEHVRHFQEDPSVGVFLISLKAGGLGLNLTAAEYVFLLDPWWNPAVEAQAIDRAHRIGQSRTVVAYRLVARDTIEEKILLLQNEKRVLADAILTEDNSVLRQLSADDLDLLLS